MSELEPLPESVEPAPVPRYVIRRIRLAHCKRGPARCEECRRMDAERICLLDVAPPRQGELQRRLIHLDGPEGGTWREFDVVKVFGSEEDAADYAARHGIPDVQL
jgi:hypothetical protein